jgi:enoyl-CoA hydratase/carnithine racemase
MILQVDRAGPVVTLTLDRPAVRNALDEELIAALQAQFSQLALDH